eukprot:symbB.v1.2.037533.t2/scaffold5572.1/size25760/1
MCEGQSLSFGSMGHPDLCRAPCVYMMKNGSCSNGVDCDFCHFVHPKKKKLNKIQRQIMQHATAGERSTLVVPILLRKLMQIEDPEVAQLIPSLLNQLGLVQGETEKDEETHQISNDTDPQNSPMSSPTSSPSSSTFLKMHELRQLHRALEGMNVSALFDLIKMDMPNHLTETFQSVQEEMMPSVRQQDLSKKVLKFWI